MIALNDYFGDMKYLILLISLSWFLGSCTRKSSIVGLWEVSSCPIVNPSDTFNDCQNGMKLLFNFKRNHSLHMFRFSKPANGQYILSGDTLITIGSRLFSEPDTFIIKELNVDKLILSNKYCTMNLNNVDSRPVKLTRFFK